MIIKYCLCHVMHASNFNYSNYYMYYDCMTFRHRANCPSVGEEHFITVAGLSHSGGSVKQLISEFFF